MPTYLPTFRDTPVLPDMLFAEPRTPEQGEMEELWALFRSIGEYWQNTTESSVGQRSSWTEFVILRCSEKPSYIAEYENALKVVAELKAEFGATAYHELLNRGLPKQGAPWTLFDHAKKFVVDEFIRVQVVAGGFRGFGSDSDGSNRAIRRPLNYNGFVRGSRYNRLIQVRAYSPKASES